MLRLCTVSLLLLGLMLAGISLTGCSSKGTEVKPDPSKTTTVRPGTGKGMDKIEQKE